MALLPRYIFKNIRHLSFGKYWFLGLDKISKFYHISLYSIKFIIIASSLIQNVFKKWKTDKFTGTDKFSKMIIFVNAQIFSLVTDSVGFWIPYIDRLVCLSVVLSCKNGDSWKMELVLPQPSCQGALLRQPCPWYMAEVPRDAPTSHRTLKRPYLKGKIGQIIVLLFHQVHS